MSGRIDIEVISDDTMNSGSDGSDSWMISYLDVLTLIIAFFVLMLALSEPVSEEEARNDGEGTGGATLMAGDGSFLQAGDGMLFRQNTAADSPAVTGADTSGATETTGTAEEAEESGGSVTEPQPDDRASEGTASISAANPRMVASLGELQERGVEVIAGDEGITIRLAEGLLFGSGRADLTAGGLLLLEELQQFLMLFEGPISVEGHTDSFPVRNSRFTSNWELSTARAISVVRFLAEGTLPDDRLRAVGYAATRPLERNITAEGRAANRRVELILRPQ